MSGVGSRRERKVVSVLFCDLVGFTSQAESLDPEDVEAILRPYHARVRTELERHGGTVEKFIGDAVMALFGAPTAHEDDPERAVRAALAIRDFAVEDGIELRVGITTGEVLVSLDASLAGGEGMASGDVVNTAARLQSAAAVNGILVDVTTYRATRAAVDYEQADPIDAKGKTEPVPVWTAVEARARYGVDTAHEARSRLVGRGRELGIVRDAFERARHERTPQLLTLVGVPGIGKSRLVYELNRIVEADPELITWRQGRCLAYGAGVTMWALAEIVKAQVGILEQDTPAVVAEKLHRAAGDALPEEDSKWVESHLLALVGLAEETDLGGNRRDEAFSAWRRYVEGLAEQRPLVVVFEDLHWADESLLDFVDELVDWLADVPLLVVATARPELLERRPHWSGGKLNATTLALVPLTDEQTAELLGSALGTPVLPAETQTALLERAGGNPLYAEQFAELYAERGSAEELALPETLQGIIAARLDGLGADEKSLMLDASVVGKVFWTAALGRDEARATATLHALERKGFVRRQRRSSVEGQIELAFAHALVRDVAYGQIPRAERAAKHRRVAEWLESLGRPEDHAEMRAYHWRSALELARASGADATELAARARFSLRDAGDRASGLSNFAAAASLYADALELWPEDAEKPGLLLRYARALHLAYDEERAQPALESARDALLAAGDVNGAAEAEALIARVFWERGDGESASAHLARAEELVGKNVSSASARVLAVSARIREIAGEWEYGLATAEAALAMAEELGLEELRAHALATIGMAKNDLNDPSGTRDMERAFEIAMAADSPVAASVLNNLAVQATIDGNLPRSDELYAEATRLAERFGDRQTIRFTRGNRLWIDYMLGRWEHAYASADAFIAECEAGSPHTQEWIARHVRAGILEGRGEIEAALADLARLLELSRRADPFHLLGALSLFAATYAEIGRRDDARRLAVEVPPLVREAGLHGALTQLAPFADELGIAEELGDAVAAGAGPTVPFWRGTIELILSDDLASAADRVESAGNPTIEARLRRHAGFRLLAQGRPADAERELGRALDFYRSVAASRYVTEIERELAGAQSDSA